MNTVAYRVNFPETFFIELIGENSIIVTAPTGEGKTFSQEFEKVATRLLGPEQTDRFLDEWGDRMLGNLVLAAAKIAPWQGIPATRKT